MVPEYPTDNKVQVMACFMMAPGHYLQQCWLIISEVQGHSFQGNFTRDAWSCLSHQFVKLAWKIIILEFNSNPIYSIIIYLLILVIFILIIISL